MRTALLICLVSLNCFAAPPAVLFSFRDDATGKVGYVNGKMQWVIAPQWDSGLEFQDNGLATVAIGNDDQRKWGCINRDGKTIIPLQYRWKVEFSEGLAPVSLAGPKKAPWGYINESGKSVIPPRYHYANPFLFHLAYVIEENWKGFIDPQGNRKITVPPTDSADSFDRDGLARILIGPGLFKYIDTNGREVCRSDQSPWHFNNQRCRVSAGRGNQQRYGYIDRSGKLAIPMKYEEAQTFNIGLAAVRLNGQWGYIDIHGQPITPFHFDSATEFTCGRATVQYQGLWGVIDLTGKWTIPPIYAAIMHLDCDHRALVSRWVKPGTRRYFVVDESYVHDSNPRKIEVPRHLINLLVNDDQSLPRAFTGLSKLTEKQRADTQAAFDLVNKARYDQAIPALEALHQQRVNPASIVLARLHQLGVGVQKDPKKAHDYYVRPMLDQDPYALYQVAQMHRTGLGQTLSYDRMRMLAEYSAEFGHAPAYRLLAALLLDGAMMDIDPAAAIQYLSAGAKANDPPCHLAIGFCFEKGLGINKDLKSATTSFTRAGELGLQDGHYHAGRLHEFQDNQAAAILSYQKAGPNHPRAQDRLTHLKPQ